MKKITISVLAVSALFLGLGALVERTSAKFRSDDAALELIAKARRAIGAEDPSAVNGMIIKGRTQRSILINGETKEISGETEISMMLPDKMMKSVKLGDVSNAAIRVQNVEKVVDVVVVGDGGQNFKVNVDNGLTPPQGQQASGAVTVVELVNGRVSANTNSADHKMTVGHGQRNNEMLRLMLGLLLTPPSGMDVEYRSGGDADFDGTACSVVIAKFAEQSVKLFIDHSTYLPVGIKYMGIPTPPMIDQGGTPMHGQVDGVKKVMVIEPVEAFPADTTNSRPTVTRVIAVPFEPKEITVKFADFRSTGGIQLPFKWTQTVDGKVDEVFTVESYDINPTNIADRFNNEAVKVRVVKPATN